MKKAGILTFHRADNVGAVLQGFALIIYLNSNFCVKSEIIDYRCEKIEETRYFGNGNFVKSLVLGIYYKLKRIGFDKFRNKYLVTSGTKYDKFNIRSNELDYDCIVTGSDQIWNLECSGNDYIYFIDFPYAGKRLSYAPSLGNANYCEKELDKIHNLLNAFDGISLRETTALKQLDFLEKSVSILPDPVFLLNVNEWSKLCKKRRNCDYIFVYLIQDDLNVVNCATKYAEEHNLRIISNKKSLDYIIRNSPLTFLEFIYNANAVFTNSFHGTAFSMIFNKKLAVDVELRNGNINHRINDILNESGLTYCIINSNKYEPKSANGNEWIRKKQIEARAYFAISL